MKLDEDQLDTLRHMLGINDGWKANPEPYRDYYCSNIGDLELAKLHELGAVTLIKADDRYMWWKTTDAGRAAALQSYKTIQKPKGARVYRRFLSAKERFTHLTFRDFLTKPIFADYRRDA